MDYFDACSGHASAMCSRDIPTTDQRPRGKYNDQDHSRTSSRRNDAFNVTAKVLSTHDRTSSSTLLVDALKWRGHDKGHETPETADWRVRLLFDRMGTSSRRCLLLEANQPTPYRRPLAGRSLGTKRGRHFPQGQSSNGESGTTCKNRHC